MLKLGGAIRPVRAAFATTVVYYGKRHQAGEIESVLSHLQQDVGKHMSDFFSPGSDDLLVRWGAITE